MTIAVGDPLPSIELSRPTLEGVDKVTTDVFFSGRRVALFAVPGAFTPTCSDTHLPGFLARADELVARGIDEIACTSVNDAFVMAAWARATGAEGVIAMLADGNGDLARALGLDLDGTAFGMGVRSRRYAAIVNGGVIEYLAVEAGPGVGVSSADALLAAL